MSENSALYTFGRGLLRPFYRVLFRYKCTNANSLPESGKCILCSNHVSANDPIFLGLTQKRQIKFMAKQELFKNRFIGKILNLLGAFPVNRGSGDGKAINSAEDLLANGQVLGIFFEGTRSKTGELLRPRAGAALIAFQTKSDILPCCITPEKSQVRIFRKVRVTYGDIIPYEQLGFSEGTPSEVRNATRIIMDSIKQMREEHKKEFAG